MKKLFAIFSSLILFSGCTDMYELSTSNHNVMRDSRRGFSANYGSAGSSKARVLKEFNRNGQKCREMDNELRSYGGEVKYVSVVCQGSNGQWNIVEKRDPYHVKRY